MITMLRGTRQVSSPGARCQLAMSHGGLLRGPAHSRCSRPKLRRLHDGGGEDAGSSIRARRNGTGERRLPWQAIRR
jgi:hypothetical protein